MFGGRRIMSSSPESAPSPESGNSDNNPSDSNPSNNNNTSNNNSTDKNSSSPSPPSPSKNSQSSSPAPDSSKSSPSPPTQNNSSPPSPNAVLPPTPQSRSAKSPPLPHGQRSNVPSEVPPPPSSNDKDEFHNKAIVGGVIGVGAVFLILAVLCLICCRKKKKRSQTYYYGDPSSLRKESGNYYNNGNHPNWNAPHGSDHVVRVHQSPNGMGPGGGWGAPPPIVNSGDMSSNYSSMGPPALPPPSPSFVLGLKGTFSYEELAAATNGFTDANLIGQGGFGYVHKGVLPDGKEVAVKSLKSGSGQGEREFQAEIDIISRVHHRHLVSLVGYSIAGGQRMLVYEFVPNNTLEYHLHGKGLPTMDWNRRLKIAVGSAKGLAYLHEDCDHRIIHRDIKAANVLLDDSFEAKVADFGLAKLTTDTNTHVSTRVMGTFGYLAPEYAASGKLTEKSDVFSFGVMLLELITGKRPMDVSNAMDDSLVDWARPLLTNGLENGNFGELVDPFLEGNYNIEEMARMAACAAASIRHSAKKRPKMSQIVRALEGDVSLDDLNEGPKPGHSTVYDSVTSSEYDSAAYNADMEKFRKAVLSSQEFGSETANGEMGHHRGTPSRRL